MCVCVCGYASAVRACPVPQTPAGIFTECSQFLPFLKLRERGNALLCANRAGGVAAFFVSRLSLPSAPSSAAPAVITRVCLRAAKLQQRPRREEEEVAVGAGREANSCLTSSQSEAWLWLTKTAGPGRAPPPHSSFEALVEMCRLLCLHSAAGCRWSRVLFLITNLRLFVDLHPLDLPQSAWSCSLSPVWLVFSVPLLKVIHSDKTKEVGQ